jgi:Domain of unknown function (DUF4351)
MVVLAELPRTRETVLLRLLGPPRLLREALEDLATLPDDTWEKSVVAPLLLHFRIEIDAQATSEEDDMSADIRAAVRATVEKFRDEGRQEGERNMLLRQLRARFGELPAAATARIHAADVAELEQWGERVLGAQTLAEVLDGAS